MASFTTLPMLSANIWTNFVFFVVALGLAFYLVYYSIVPWHAGAGAANRKSGLWQDPRPTALWRFLLMTISSLVVASLLNIVYFGQGLSSSGGEGPSLRIPNLQFGGWLALMSISNIFGQLPFALLFLTLINILQSRWYALHKHSTGQKLCSTVSFGSGDSTEYKFPAFLGWKGKEGASFLVAFFLFFTPILSNVALSIGLSKYPNPILGNGNQDAGDFNEFNRINKFCTVADAWHAVMVIVAVSDVIVSSFSLFQAMRKSHYYDLITAIISSILTPFLIIIGLQTIITSSFHSFSNASQSTLASLDYVNFLLTTIVVALTTGLLLCLYPRTQKWMLASTQAPVNPGPHTIRLGEVSSVSVDLPELPKLSYLSRDSIV